MLCSDTDAVKAFRIHITLMALTGLVAAALLIHFIHKPSKVEEVRALQAKQLAELRDWLSRCNAAMARASGVKDAEDKFLKGDKRLILSWENGGDVRVPIIYGFSGDPRTVATGAPITVNIPGPSLLTDEQSYGDCDTYRYVTDYNLTMLRLIGRRKIGQHGAGGYPPTERSAQ